MASECLALVTSSSRAWRVSNEQMFKTHLDTRLQLVKLFALLVADMDVVALLLFDLLEGSSHVIELALVEGILEATPVTVFLLVLLEFLLLRLELVETVLDGCEELDNLGPLRIWPVSARVLTSVDIPVSSMIRVDSLRFCSYTLVPATSLSRFRRSLSDMFVKWVIWGGQHHLLLSITLTLPWGTM